MRRRSGTLSYRLNFLYVNTLKEKFNKMYEKLRLEMYANAIRILSKGYLPISLLPPTKLKKNLDELKKAIQIANPDYNIVISRLHLYYNIKLVTFGINEGNLIFQFSYNCTYNRNLNYIKLKQYQYLF